MEETSFLPPNYTLGAPHNPSNAYEWERYRKAVAYHILEDAAHPEGYPEDFDPATVPFSSEWFASLVTRVTAPLSDYRAVSVAAVPGWLGELTSPWLARPDCALLADFLREATPSAEAPRVAAALAWLGQRAGELPPVFDEAPAAPATAITPLRWGGTQAAALELAAALVSAGQVYELPAGRWATVRAVLAALGAKPPTTNPTNDLAKLLGRNELAPLLNLLRQHLESHAAGEPFADLKRTKTG